MKRHRRGMVAVLGALLAAVLCGASGSTPGFGASTHLGVAASAAARSNHPDHIVIVVLENHSFSEVLGRGKAPYLQHLAASGTNFSNFFAIGHPSQPNYFALFSGSTHNVGWTNCPLGYAGPDLGSSLIKHGYTFAGYSEGLPRVGSTACRAGRYRLRHAPWTSFADLPSSVSRPMRDFPSDYRALPTVSFVIPNLDHDMHDGTVAASDSWIRHHLSSYASWSRTHNSLLIVTTDEDDRTADNRIATMIIGDHIRVGVDHQHLTLYSLLRFIEDSYNLPRLGHSTSATPIRNLR